MMTRSPFAAAECSGVTRLKSGFAALAPAFKGICTVEVCCRYAGGMDGGAAIA